MPDGRTPKDMWEHNAGSWFGYQMQKGRATFVDEYVLFLMNLQPQFFFFFFSFAKECQDAYSNTVGQGQYYSTSLKYRKP